MLSGGYHSWEQVGVGRDSKALSVAVSCWGGSAFPLSAVPVGAR